MTRWLSMPGALALLVGACVAPVAGPIDLPAVLVGTWEGEVEMAAGNYPRTLIITAVKEIDGRRVADAAYGGAGGGADPRVLPVLVNIEAFGKDVILRFATVDGWSIELSLYPDRRHLFGDLRIPVALGGTRALNPIKLTKRG